MAVTRREGVLVVLAGLGTLAVVVLLVRPFGPGDVAPSRVAARDVGIAGGPSPAVLAAELDSLRSVVELEREKREALELQVAALRAVLSGDGDAAAFGAAASPLLGAGAGDDERDSETTPDVAASGPGRAPLPSFDRDGLASAGVHRADIDELYDRWNQLEMDKLYLADQARREGWAGTGRYRRERRSLQDAVRGELDEDAWDQWLYATGNNNRVLVGDVLDASPGERAGLQPGDQILRYAGQRVHSVRDVRRVTAEGVAGEAVRVEVLRDGQPRTVGLERGPIGVILKEQREQPGAG